MQDSNVIQVTISKCHPKTRPFDCREVLDERLQLLMIKHVTSTRPDHRIVKHHPHCIRAHYWWRRYPIAAVPMSCGLGNFPQVDFRVEIRCECLPMIPPVRIQNIDICETV